MLSMDYYINTEEGWNMLAEHGLRSEKFQRAKSQWENEKRKPVEIVEEKKAMNNMMVFNNKMFGSVRTLQEGNKVLFCGKDVAECLGYIRANDAIRQHCRGTVKHRIGVKTGTKADGTPSIQTIEMNFIPESDLYRLIINSKLPSAEKFERWVMEEVLPSIRKHGGYVQGQEEMSPEELMAKAVLYADSKIKEMEVMLSKLEVDKQILQPKADYFDELVSRNLLTSFRDTAKQLQISEKKFIQFLMDKKYIYRNKRGRLSPYAKKGDGLFEVKEYINRGLVGTQTLLTPKGREVFRLLTKGL